MAVFCVAAIAGRDIIAHASFLCR